MEKYFFIIFYTTLCIWLLTLLYFCKNIYFEGKNSDTFKQFNLSKKIPSFFPYFSSMHEFSDKSHAKDMTVILISAISNTLNFKNGLFNITFLLSNLHILNSLMLFFFLNSNFGYEISAILSIIYLLSLYSNFLIIYGSHNVIGAFFFLVTINILNLFNTSNELITNLIYLLFSGLTFGFFIFSSPSTFKLFFLVFGYFFYKINFLESINNKLNYFYVLFIFNIIFFIFLDYSNLIKNFIKKNFFLNHVKNENVALQIHGLSKVINIFLLLSFFLVWYFIFIDSKNLINFLVFILSFFFCIFYLLYPKITKNIKNYIQYSFIQIWGNHFFNSKNTKLKKSMIRYERNLFLSMFWSLVLFFRLQPFYFLSYLFFALNASFFYFSLEKIFVLFLTLYPLIYLGRTYGPIIISTTYTFFLVSIFSFGYFIYYSMNIDSQYKFYILIITMVTNSVYSIYFLKKEFIDPDSYIFRLKEFINKYNIKKFYTINEKKHFTHFFDNINFHFHGKIKFVFIKSFKNLKNKFLLIPPMNPHSIIFHSSEILHNSIYPRSINKYKDFLTNSNFNSSKNIKIPTKSSSKFYMYQGDITCFLTIFKDILSLKDLNLGYLRIIKI
jgi:hypothetical protein